MIEGAQLYQSTQIREEKKSHSIQATKEEMLYEHTPGEHRINSN